MIYCVEDDDAIRELMIYSLKTAGFEARGFADAEAFWPVIEQELPDLVLLDVMMPNVDGYTTIQEIKKQEKLKNCKVVFLSAKTNPADIEKGLKLGADAYVTKPYSIKKLTQQIDELLET